VPKRYPEEFRRKVPRLEPSTQRPRHRLPRTTTRTPLITKDRNHLHRTLDRAHEYAGTIKPAFFAEKIVQAGHVRRISFTRGRGRYSSSGIPGTT
jgi:hypothetical protein